MKRLRSNYHIIHVLKTAVPRLRKANISNCNKELMNCISECVLTVLKRKTKLTVCNTRKLQNHRAALLNVFERHLPLSFSQKKRLLVQRGGFLLSLLSAVLPTIANLILRGKWENMLRKMYLVPADRMQRPLSRKNHLMYEDKKHLKYHLYEKWDKMRQKKGGVDRQKTETKVTADILRRLMHYSSKLSSKSPPHTPLQKTRRGTRQLPLPLHQ